MNIKKSIIAVFLASFVGIMANPEMLAASNSVAVNGLDQNGIVQTMLPKMVDDGMKLELEAKATENASASKKPQVLDSSYNTFAYEAPEASEPQVAEPEPEPVYEVPSDNIQIAGRTLEIVSVSTTATDSGDHVNKYGTKFYWGHNSGNVFRGLYDYGVGSTFTMTEGGVTTNYIVKAQAVFQKNFETNTLQQNGSGNYMMTLVNGRYQGKTYDVVLMTCYGASVGSGDATERYVLFANAI